jgi:hypothetical protein
VTHPCHDERRVGMPRTGRPRLSHATR